MVSPRAHVLYVSRTPDAVVNRLRDRGMSVTTVGSAEDALAAADADDVHCALAELDGEATARRDGGTLPGDRGDPADGPDPIEACAALRQYERDLPLILRAPAGLGERGGDAIEAGVTGVVESADVEAAADRVERAVERYRERRAERRQLVEDSDMLQALLQNLPLSIYFKDEQGRHQRVSHHMLCGEDPDLYLENDEGKAHQHPHDLLGKTDLDIYGAGGESGLESDQEVMETGEPILDCIEESRTRLGEQVFYSTTKAPRYDDDGSPAGVVGITLEVTERMKRKRELERQNERLERFADIVSHDLRNPLTVAQGNLELIAEEYDGDPLAECRAALDRMDELIEELLAFARQGRTVVDPDLVDLEQVAREAWRSVETGDADLAVEVELPVKADRARLKRVLENLFRNAVEHGSTSPRSSSTPEDAVEHGASDDGPLTVTVADDGTDFYVEDDGPGIPPEERESVFDRGVSRHEEGTGFGLANVRTIAEAHGWEVAAEEGASGGARIAFSGVARGDTQH